jgi:hypothetical protein
VLYCFPDGRVDKAWEDQVIAKIWKHAKELSQFRNGSGNLLPKAGGDRRQVSMTWDDFDIAILKVGVPKSVYKANDDFFQSTQRYLSDSTLGGLGDLKLRPIAGGQKKPIKTIIVPFNDLNFVQMPGNIYEVVKGASIHGQSPGTFKTIDKLNTSKNRVISYKSIDLYATSYAAAGGAQSLNSVKSTMRGYIKALKDFRGASLTIGDRILTVRGADFTEKRLSVAIPMLSVTDLQFYKAAFELLVTEATAARITLRVHRAA